ncbi:MAG: GNAT family N-acetyltransferase [Thermoplasmata archaeon]
MQRSKTKDHARLAIEIQDFQPQHYEDILEIHNILFPDRGMSLEELRFDDESWDYEKYTFKRRVAVNAADEVVAFGEYGHSPSVFHPQKFWLEINVHPKWQRCGIGTLLYDTLLGELRGLGAIEVRSGAQESRPEAVRFLQKRGFVEKMRTWESALDLSRFDPSKFRRSLEPLEGVEITTLAHERNDRSDLELRLYDLAKTLMKDVPLPGNYTPVSLELFRRWTLESPGTMPEGYFLAKVRDEYVGQCVLERQLGLEKTLHHGLTGVRREYRRRGIAMALKVRALAWAKGAGYATVRTWNDSKNQGMLAINERLGFEREPAWISFGKELRGKDDQ